jgi:hypothetical protein
MQNRHFTRAGRFRRNDADPPATTSPAPTSVSACPVLCWPHPARRRRRPLRRARRRLLGSGWALAGPWMCVAQGSAALCSSRACASPERSDRRCSAAVDGRNVEPSHRRVAVAYFTETRAAGREAVRSGLRGSRNVYSAMKGQPRHGGNGEGIMSTISAEAFCPSTAISRGLGQ